MSDSSKGLAYAQADFDLMAQFGASASPALVLNGVPVSEFEFAAGNGMQGSERSAENVKQLLCYGFASPPAACNASLSTEVASTGLSEQYSGGSSTGGSCN